VTTFDAPLAKLDDSMQRAFAIALVEAGILRTPQAVLSYWRDPSRYESYFRRWTVLGCPNSAVYADNEGEDSPGWADWVEFATNQARI